MSAYDLAIVIPAWNERENLELLLPALREIVGALGLRAQIIVADGGSVDGTEQVAPRVGAEGWRIREIPFHYMARGSGRSHARLLRFGWAYLKTLVRMRQLRNSVEAADYDARAFDSPIWLQHYWQRTRHRIVLDYMAES